MPLERNSNIFIFDNEMLAQTVFSDFRIGENSRLTRYFPDASSINSKRSVKFGLGVLSTDMILCPARGNSGKSAFYLARLRKIRERSRGSGVKR